MTENSLLINEAKLCEVFAQHWWVLLLRGIAALIFGIMSYWVPGLSIATLVLFFGAYCFADGVLSLWTAYQTRNKHKAWLPLILNAVFNIGIGVLTFISPGSAAIVLVMVIAIWSIVSGFVLVMTAIDLRKEIENEWTLGLGGILSVLFGGLVIAQPQVGALAIVWMIAAYAIAMGILFIVLAFKLKGMAERNELKNLSGHNVSH